MFSAELLTDFPGFIPITHYRITFYHNGNGISSGNALMLQYMKVFARGVISGIGILHKDNSDYRNANTICCEKYITGAQYIVKSLDRRVVFLLYFIRWFYAAYILYSGGDYARSYTFMRNARRGGRSRSPVRSVHAGLSSSLPILPQSGHVDDRQQQHRKSAFCGIPVERV